MTDEMKTYLGRQPHWNHKINKQIFLLPEPVIETEPKPQEAQETHQTGIDKATFALWTHPVTSFSS